eukprot:10348175-Lingulodinium_polyedra.AAC.1
MDVEAPEHEQQRGREALGEFDAIKAAEAEEMRALEQQMEVARSRFANRFKAKAAEVVALPG